MDKKKIIIPLICIFFLLTSSVYVKADVIIPVSFGEEFIDYLTLESMSIALTEGAELSWADLNLGEASLTAEEKVRRMFAYYRAKAWNLETTGLLGMLDFFAGGDHSDLESSAIGFSLNSGLTSENISSLQNQISNKVIGLNNEDYRMGMSDYNIAYWTQYNPMYLSDYLDRMNYIAIEDIPEQPSPDPNYSFISNLNNAYITYRDVSYSFFDFTGNFIDNSNSILSHGDLKEYSFICETVFHESTPNSIYNLQCSTISPLITININTDPIVNVTYTSYTPLRNDDVFSNFSGTYGRTYNFTAKIKSGSTSSITIQDGNNNPYIYNQSSFNTLSDALDYIYAHYLNVNLYVNGNLWVKSTNIPIEQWHVSIPNAVTDNGTDDGKIVSAPIFWVEDEITGNPVDNWDINLSKVMDMLVDKVSNGQTSVSIQDLVDAGAIEKEGTAIGTGTGAVAGVKSLADSIADSRTLPGDVAVTLEDVVAGEIPGLPVLPSMGVNPAFQGITVLSRIINIANQSLPNDLIVCFWGVVFGAALLGLIKMLHK